MRAKYEKNHHKEAWHLLKSGRYYDSHHIILHHIAADAIINGKSGRYHDSHHIILRHIAADAIINVKEDIQWVQCCQHILYLKYYTLFWQRIKINYYFYFFSTKYFEDTKKARNRYLKGSKVPLFYFFF